jgi:hypothetical protein
MPPYKYDPGALVIPLCVRWYSFGNPLDFLCRTKGKDLRFDPPPVYTYKVVIAPYNTLSHDKHTVRKSDH